MGKRIIGIDFDDVLIDTFAEFLAYCNTHYGEQFQLQDFTSFEYDQVWKITKDQRLERFLAFDSSEAKKNIRPMDGSQEAIIALIPMHDLHIITARPVEIAEGTHVMINQHFPERFKGVHFCSTDNGANYLRPKHVVCKEIGATVHIEDHPVTAQKCAEEGIRTLLFDRPWNQDVSHKLITRVYSWKQIFVALCRL